MKSGNYSILYVLYKKHSYIVYHKTFTNSYIILNFIKIYITFDIGIYETGMKINKDS